MKLLKNLIFKIKVRLGLVKGFYRLEYRGIPIIQRDDVPPDTVYLINNDYMFPKFPYRKDGKPDMRYSINKLERIFNEKRN